jgi:hypothetical protein
LRLQGHCEGPASLRTFVQGVTASRKDNQAGLRPKTLSLILPSQISKQVTAVSIFRMARVSATPRAACHHTEPPRAVSVPRGWNSMHLRILLHLLDPCKITTIRWALLCSWTSGVCRSRNCSSIMIASGVQQRCRSSVVLRRFMPFAV